jgi:hypothetical protein
MAMVERVLASLVGIALVVWVLDAAVRTFMLPRASRVTMTRWIGIVVEAAFRVVAPRSRSYRWRDRVWALRPPVTLLAYQASWLFGVFVGFTFLFCAIDDLTLAAGSRESGSSLFTLGFANPSDERSLLLVYAEAFIGLTLLALLISYLPTIYAAFERREFLVAKLSVRAGLPPLPWAALAVAWRTGSLRWVDDTMWGEWEDWFIDLAESHTSLTILNTYRSPEPADHWLAAARCVLDLAALRISVVDVEVGAGPSIALRAGFLTLQSLARFFRYPVPDDPRPDDPISITREQFDAACAHLAAAGVPLKPDLDAAWRDFAGWRVNYDGIIEAAAARLDVPPSPWTAMAT